MSLSSRFLNDDQSPGHRFYQEKLQEYRAEASGGSSSPQPNAAPRPHIPEADNPPVKRKRKSRWGSEDDKVELPMPPIVVPQEINLPDPNIPSLSGTRT